MPRVFRKECPRPLSPLSSYGTSGESLNLILGSACAGVSCAYPSPLPGHRHTRSANGETWPSRGYAYRGGGKGGDGATYSPPGIRREAHGDASLMCGIETRISVRVTESIRNVTICRNSCRLTPLRSSWTLQRFLSTTMMMMKRLSTRTDLLRTRILLCALGHTTWLLHRIDAEELDVGCGCLPLICV